MHRNLFALGTFLCIAICLAGLWMGSSITLAAPLEQLADQSPQALAGGTEDVRRFFASQQFTADFRVTAATRDEALSRRYYRVKLDPAMLPHLTQQLKTNWTLGHFSRAVYENGVAARVKKSRNLPTWWNLTSPPAATHLMLDRAGQPMWYIVLADSGEVCLMWAGR